MGCPLVYYVAASADGYIATADDGLEWLPQPGAGASEDYGYAEFLATVDGIVMGRRTWQFLRSLGSAWPYGERPGWVLTQRPLEADTPPSVQAAAFDLDALRGAWAARGLKRVWLVGGGAVAGCFAAASAIDEIILTTVPVRLGCGVPLFGARGTSLDGWVRSAAPLRQWPDGLSQRVLHPAWRHGSATTATPS